MGKRSSHRDRRTIARIGDYFEVSSDLFRSAVHAGYAKTALLHARREAASVIVDPQFCLSIGQHQVNR